MRYLNAIFILYCISLNAMEHVPQIIKFDKMNSNNKQKVTKIYTTFCKQRIPENITLSVGSMMLCALAHKSSIPRIPQLCLGSFAVRQIYFLGRNIDRYSRAKNGDLSRFNHDFLEQLGHPRVVNSLVDNRTLYYWTKESVEPKSWFGIYRPNYVTRLRTMELATCDDINVSAIEDILKGNLKNRIERIENGN